MGSTRVGTRGALSKSALHNIMASPPLRSLHSFCSLLPSIDVVSPPMCPYMRLFFLRLPSGTSSAPDFICPFPKPGDSPYQGWRMGGKAAQLPSSGEINPGLPYTAGASVRSAGITFSESVARGNSSLWSRQKRISRTYVT